MPTPTEAITPDTIAQSGATAENPDTQGSQDAGHATEARENHGFEQKLQPHFAAPGAHRESEADLARALRDADEHHVGDSDRTDEETDCGQADRGESDPRTESIKRRDDLIRG
jgi:hypothetical protein